MNRQQNVVVGAFLIGLGIVWWFNLWWLIWPGLLAAAGVVAYTQRRRAGRKAEAVQVGLWLVGLALLFILHFTWPGILFLAGSSILIRGREEQVDDQVQQFIGNLGQRRASQRPLTTQQVPVTTQVPVVNTASEGDPSTTGETTRL
jgi:TM2 domain-containing membrane protein YozV